MSNSLPLVERRGASASTQLLDRIRAARASVGDGLNDIEFTRYFLQTLPPPEAGFSFLGFSDGFVALTVPEQELAEWYPERGWISPAKEQVARGLAERYGLSLAEPPDECLSCLSASSESGLLPTHHHLEFTNDAETVIVAHPRYLKVRMFGAVPRTRYVPSGKAPVLFGPALLADFAALYPT